ncbi:MAG: cytochrome C biogenesis protein, partial [Candidatus Sedimenticola endophacoides]
MLLAVSFAAQGAIEAYRFDDPEKEARYKVLIDELRCLVCQNQNQ